VRGIGIQSMGLNGTFIENIILVFFDSQFVVKKSPNNYPKELPNCPHCGIVIGRDVNPGIN
jgi:hypothetical protein